MTRCESARRALAEPAQYVAVLAVIALVVALVVNVWNFHASNLEQCLELGGSYNAMDGTGQCVRDQVILFDPRHPLDEVDR